jgi:hypothetical protein
VNLPSADHFEADAARSTGAIEDFFGDGRMKIAKANQAERQYVPFSRKRAPGRMTQAARNGEVNHMESKFQQRNSSKK